MLHCLANAFPRAPLESVMCRGTGNECLLYCVQEMGRLDTANRLSHILPDGSPITGTLREQSKLKSQLLMCVERRLVYASAVSLDKAFSADGADCILQSSSDIFAGVRAMSADLAQVLYPLLQTRIAAPHKLWRMWKAVRVERIPAPVMLFLIQAYPNTDWSTVLRTRKGASEGRLTPCETWVSMEKVKTHRRMGHGSNAIQHIAASSTTSSTATGSATVPAAVVRTSAPSKLTCRYKYWWITHSGWMTGIYLEKSSPHFRFVCAGCLQYLQLSMIKFELHPSSEEDCQIVEEPLEAIEEQLFEDSLGAPSLAASSSTSSTATESAMVQANVVKTSALKRVLPCGYGNGSHSGRMTGIYLAGHGKRRFRYACAACLEHLLDTGVRFDWRPSPEEDNQIVREIV